MATCVALLRGINVSGQKPVRMDALRVLCEALGFVRVRTYLQSGNVVFDSDELPQHVTARLEASIADSFGFAVPVLMRTVSQVADVLTTNPFAGEDMAHCYVAFLGEWPLTENVARLPTSPGGSADQWALRGGEVYLRCPGGYGRTKLTNAFLESKLSVRATTRNWRTVGALHNMMTA